MIKKTILPFLLVFFCSTTLFAQYYETSWISNGVKYTGFVAKTGDNQYLFRIKYIVRGEDKLASYQANSKEFTKSDGTKSSYLDGQNGRIVRGSKAAGYSADNWYFESEENQVKAFTVDDNGYSGGDITQSMKPALYWISIDANSLTDSYLSDYFNRDEPMFKVLNAVKTGEFNLTTTKSSIIEVEFAQLSPDAEWCVVVMANPGTIYKQQDVKTSKVFPNSWINEHWKQGYTITEATYSESHGEYMVLMSKPYNWGSQTWKKSATIPLDWISSKRQDDYFITELAHLKNEWFVVMNKRPGYTGQLHKFATELPVDWMNKNKGEGYRVTSVDFGGQFWGVVLSRNTGIGKQEWTMDSEYPIDFIRNKAGDGYKLTHLSYGGGKWVAVMSEDPTLSSNSSTIQKSSLPLFWVMDKAN